MSFALIASFPIVWLRLPCAAAGVANRQRPMRNIRRTNGHRRAEDVLLWLMLFFIGFRFWMVTNIMTVGFVRTNIVYLLHYVNFA